MSAKVWMVARPLAVRRGNASEGTEPEIQWLPALSLGEHPSREAAEQAIEKAFAGTERAHAVRHLMRPTEVVVTANGLDGMTYEAAFDARERAAERRACIDDAPAFGLDAPVAPPPSAFRIGAHDPTADDEEPSS